MFFVIFFYKIEYKQSHYSHDHVDTCNISNDYIQELFSEFESMSIDVDVTSLTEILQKIYNLFLVLRNTINIQIPTFIFKRIHFIVFEMETESKIKSISLLILREIIRRRDYFNLINIDIVTDLMIFSEGFQFPFYEWTTVLKEVALLSDDYSKQIVEEFPYEQTISYLFNKEVCEYSYIAEIFICIKCTLSADCIDFIYKLVDKATKKCYETNSQIKHLEAIIKLIKRAVHDSESFSLFTNDNLLQNIIKMSVSFNVNSVIHESIELWCNIISDYDADFCIDFF